ncbi:MAG: HDIG domain-containing protein [Rhodothermales bacterium]|nr:HDIG domain-containing protein [Rhodothermales bacterium]MBO6781526.1 HDIG domain-containing protein [Rhodothermales bacterium]
MALFKRDPKKARRAKAPVVRLEGVGAEEQKARRRAQYRKTSIFLALVVLTVLAFVRGGTVKQQVTEGDVWRQDNLSAPFDFAIEKPAAVQAAEQEEARTTTPPVFNLDPEYLRDARERSDTLLARIERALEARARFQANRLRGRQAEATADSVVWEALRAQINLPLNSRHWRLLFQSYNERIPGASSASRAPSSGPRLDARVMVDVWSLSQQTLRAGILDVSKDSILASQVEVRDLEDRTREERPITSVYDVAGAIRTARENLSVTFDQRPDTVGIAMAFFGRVAQPNLLYDEATTRDRWNAAISRLSQNAGRVRVNEVIVRRGDVITEDIQLKISSLERALDQRRGARLVWQTLAGQLMLTLAIYVWFFLYLFLLRRVIFEDNRMVLLLAILFTMVVVMYGTALRIEAIDVYMVPVAIAAVLMTVIFDSRVAIFGLLTMAVLGSVLAGMDLVYLLSTLFAGTLGVFSVRDIRNRSQFFVSAGVVYLGYVVILLAAFLLESTSLERFLDQLLFVAINSVLVLLAYGFLWAFERGFGLTTDVTLLELSDTNRPLLKELSLKAPGTFNHTLQVANLAEAAASAIGANALLTRVGALYHDVGKMEKPEYFVENQRGGHNPHDQLKPRMSALIIASHVKEGLATAEEYGLPDAVNRFIPMHHGTTRIEYFYRKAIDGQSDDDEVMESDFRYPGPRPDSKETAILMLADSVEAASRTLDNPTHKKLKTLIDGLVESRVDDHQLSDTDLTFRDLTRIKETFLNLLMGQFHGRVKYPGGTGEGSEADADAPTATNGQSDTSPAPTEQTSRPD